jgi:hypothetical protein
MKSIATPQKPKRRIVRPPEDAINLFQAAISQPFKKTGFGQKSENHQMNLRGD